MPTLTRKKQLIILITLTLCVLTVIKPLYPKYMFLQHIGTLLLFAGMFWDLRTNRLSIKALIAIAIYTLLHSIGARYIYSYVPYRELFMSVFDWDINLFFGSDRNHYDRFVHFAFGLLFFPAAYDIFSKYLTAKFIVKILFAWLFIQTFSMIYELFEWALTLVLSTEAANDYNGQQGDNWDAHKDMALAGLGSTFTALVYIFRSRKTPK